MDNPGPEFAGLVAVQLKCMQKIAQPPRCAPSRKQGRDNSKKRDDEHGGNPVRRQVFCSKSVVGRLLVNELFFSRLYSAGCFQKVSGGGNERGEIVHVAVVSRIFEYHKARIGDGVYKIFHLPL